MERFLIFAAMGIGIVFGQSAPVTGSLTGKVVDATTKAGIRNATVYATVQGPPPVPGEGVRFAPPNIYSAVTGDGGIYRFPVLPPGPVQLRTERAGHLPRPADGRERMVVKGGEETTAAELPMVKQAIIAGRVTDSDGEPMEQVSVTAIPSGRKRMDGTVSMGHAMTDDRGEFRIPRLSAGKYKLLATKQANGFITSNPRVAGEPVLVNAPTYFPSVLEQAAASEIAIGGGGERTGLEIRLRKRVAVRVAGQVMGEIGKDGMVSVTLQSFAAPTPGTHHGRGMNGWQAMAGADGQFVFPNVIAGEYMAFANWHRSSGGGNTPLSGFARLNVGRQDVDQLAIRLEPLVRIAGKVVAEGGGNLPFPQLSLGFSGVEPGMPGGGGGAVNPDGTFLIENVQRARLKVISMAPRGWYLKAIAVGGQRQSGLEFELSAGETQMELIYSNRPGEVKVTVEGLTTESSFHVAIALPDGGNGASPLTTHYKSAPVPEGQSGTNIEDVPPGNYQILVCPLGLLDALSDPVIWERLKNKAVAVKVEEGVTVSASPRLILDSDVEEN